MSTDLNFLPGPYPPGQHIIPPPRPDSPATSEFRLNHLMLRIKDPEASLRFYNDCLGLHVVFIFNAGPWTIYYLGPRDVDRRWVKGWKAKLVESQREERKKRMLKGNQTIKARDRRPWRKCGRWEGMAEIGTSKELLELYYIPSDKNREYTSGNDYSKGGVGFGHIGFTVPDVGEALKRVKEFGYEVIKPLDEAKVGQMGLPRNVAEEEVVEGYRHVFRQLAFVRDPDGYWVELVPQVVKPPPTSSV
ncbi:Glyoxalase/Bleomycin resistance protein/Dihydroxybiphenyl dioxygenase [Zopfia rhizophila CBS 207.26]|uniref:Glyoxalase/Bleomycin resistance protein/Dihydroxybiphenyl dioxygenase n=1 Tax=Zopfia rhizophila CBS 207.26 TaxID=1314779 RepID=A0A6A6DGC9_9PEZI|nr:Glyoxalase/Bleomycin resistance protein/Dihydroxybiphenyl dioxygenase [Zopfia rhizophila CBS 207.26]